jgi:hypothetical protein
MKEKYIGILYNQNTTIGPYYESNKRRLLELLRTIAKGNKTSKKDKFTCIVSCIDTTQNINNCFQPVLRSIV